MSFWSHLVPIRACKKKLVTTTKSSGNNNNLAPASNGHSMAASLSASSSDVPEKNSHTDKSKSAENMGNGGNVSYPTKPGGMAINGSSKVAPVPNKMPVHIQMGKGLATSSAPAAATTTLTSLASNQVCYI